MFAASLLASLPEVNNNIEMAVNVAARLAAISVTRAGTDSFPTFEEVQAAMLENQPESYLKAKNLGQHGR